MRRWEEDLRATLEADGVQMIAICTDTPSQIQAGKAKHGLQAPILSDASLSVIDKLGLRNTNPAVKPPGVVGLPVPTTLFVDELGIVRWKDQSTDYQRRSNPERVLSGLAELNSA